MEVLSNVCVAIIIISFIALLWNNRELRKILDERKKRKQVN